MVCRCAACCCRPMRMSCWPARMYRLIAVFAWRLRSLSIACCAICTASLYAGPKRLATETPAGSAVGCGRCCGCGGWKRRLLLLCVLTDERLGMTSTSLGAADDERRGLEVGAFGHGSPAATGASGHAIPSTGAVGNAGAAATGGGGALEEVDGRLLALELPPLGARNARRRASRSIRADAISARRDCEKMTSKVSIRGMGTRESQLIPF